MTKKYNSQATIENILNVASKLFLEKGFERTRMQDIAETAGISKGAIYHHFKSKEEIINAVIDNQTQTNKSMFENWLSETEAYSGKEKLIAILEKNIDSQETHCLDEIMSTRMKSAEFVLSYMQNCVNQDAVFISDIIKQGIGDGSLVTNFPDESAEVFLLLMNVWCDPAVFSCNIEKLSHRLKFLQYLMKSLGIDVLSDLLLGKTLDILQKLYGEENHSNE